MQANRPRGTSPELALQLALKRARLRFLTDAAPEAELKCKADIVFRKARVCVFVDGCYWHGCPRHFALPKTNSAWWLEKVTDNKLRDRRKRAALRRFGWVVIRVWECELTAKRIDRTMTRIISVLGTRATVSRKTTVR